MAKEISIKLSDLMINPENYRFDFAVTNEKDAINKILDEKKSRKLIFNLIKDVIKNGINPTKMSSVVCTDEGKYRLLDGNRRVTALKILNDSTLISGKNSSFKEKIEKLKKESKKTLLDEIKCILFQEEDEAKKWILLEHTGQNEGIGTIPWDRMQKQEFLKKSGKEYSFSMQILNKLLNAKEISKKEIEKLKTKTSNLDRLINNKKIREILGLELKDNLLQNLEKKEQISKLKKIIEDLSKNSTKVKEIYDKKEQINYVNKVLKNTKNIDLNKNSRADNKKSQNYKERNTLIPKSCKISIENKKILKLYKELQLLDLKKFIHTPSFSFRVFIELSMNFYLEEHKLIGDHLSSMKCGMDLKQKISTVANHLKNTDKIDKSFCQGIKNEINKKKGLLNIDIFNAYLHNHSFSPTRGDLITMWDNIQNFIEKVWENVK